MKTIVKTIFALLLALPLAAQSSSVTLLHIGEGKGQLYEALQALPHEDGLVEMGMHFHSMRPDSPHYAGVAGELRLSPNSTWALFDDGRRCLAQGMDLPTAEDLRKTIDEAGIKSPIRVLRDFLKQHPHHLEARMQLLELLRGIAESRTRRVLQLGLQPPLESVDRWDAERWYRAYSDALDIDLSPFEGKKLDPEQDLQIWGLYAHEFHALFSTGEWRHVVNGVFSPKFMVPTESCSPMVTQLYGQHLGSVEAFLSEQPGHIYVWETYGWMRRIARQGVFGASPIGSVLGDIVPSPGLWRRDGERLSILIPEERELGNWESLVTELWSMWPMFRFEEGIVKGAFFREHSLESLRTESSRQGLLEVSWRDRLKPLLESLIKTNRIGEAEQVIVYIAKINALLEIQRRAAELALDSGRKDLHDRWKALKVPEKTTVSDPDEVEDLYFEITPVSSNVSLIVINGQQFGEQISALLKHYKIIEWKVRNITLDQAQSELLCEEEGWPKGETYWALRDRKAMLAHGPGLPNENEIFQVLQNSVVEKWSETLRRFILEHPTHTDAKINLLRESIRVAEQRTKDKIGTMAGRDPQLLLDDEDDEAIWGDLSRRFKQLFLTMLDTGLPWFWTGPLCESRLFMHSNKMKDVARGLLPSVEAFLMHQPNDNSLWDIWLSMSELDGRRRYTDLKETLVLSPKEDPRLFPSMLARGRLVKHYLERSDWQALINVLESPWAVERDRPTEKNEWTWSTYQQHLLEAYLRLGKDYEADMFLTAWEQSPAWETVLQGAIALAEKCDRDTLAERWKRLK